MGDYDGVCIEWGQPAEVRFVTFNRNNSDAASCECGDRVDRAGMRIVEPAQKRIAGRDAGADDVSGKAKGQRQRDCERR